MAGSENRQLLVAGAVAFAVLGAGAFLWFAPADSSAPATPRALPQVATARDEPSAPVSAETAAPDRKQVAPIPNLVAGLKQPRVRPPEAEPALYAALTAIQPAFQACYAATLADDPSAKGRAVLQFDLQDGALNGPVAVELRVIPSVTLRDCLAAATPTADFSAVQGLTRVIWPLLMWPDKGLSVQAPVGRLDGR